MNDTTTTIYFDRGISEDYYNVGISFTTDNEKIFIITKENETYFLNLDKITKIRVVENVRQNH